MSSHASGAAQTEAQHGSLTLQLLQPDMCGAKLDRASSFDSIFCYTAVWYACTSYVSAVMEFLEARAKYDPMTNLGSVASSLLQATGIYGCTFIVSYVILPRLGYGMTAGTTLRLAAFACSTAVAICKAISAASGPESAATCVPVGVLVGWAVVAVSAAHGARQPGFELAYALLSLLRTAGKLFTGLLPLRQHKAPDTLPSVKAKRSSVFYCDDQLIMRHVHHVCLGMMYTTVSPVSYLET